MRLEERIHADLKETLRSGDDVRKGALRMLIAAVHNARIAAGRPMTDEDVAAVVQQQIRQRRDSIEQFRAGNRPDLVAREEAEMAALEAYRPQQLTPDELRAIVREVIAETGAQGPGDRGRVMGAIMPRVKGRAEGRTVSEIVGELLSG